MTRTNDRAAASRDPEYGSVSRRAIRADGDSLWQQGHPHRSSSFPAKPVPQWPPRSSRSPSPMRSGPSSPRTPRPPKPNATFTACSGPRKSCSLDRGQPVVTYNRIKRKINTICGIIEKLRQDPKAYPRNPQRQAEDGAEIATKTLNYALGWQWTEQSTTVARKTAIRGLSGVELVLVAGRPGRPGNRVGCHRPTGFLLRSEKLQA